MHVIGKRKKKSLEGTYKGTRWIYSGSFKGMYDKEKKIP